MSDSAHQVLQVTLKADRARILSSLIRSCGGDFDLAEEALQDAVVAATTQWPRRGVPDAPNAWLLQTARHKAIDVLRQDQRRRAKLGELGYTASLRRQEDEMEPIPYDMLRLIFTCCHPALNEEARLALTLRTVAGLPTIEIARAFLVSEQTMAQRLVRAKKKIREARIPYRVPERREMPERLDAVLLVIYLVFNEGYSASSGQHVVRRELCAHAIHIGRVLLELMPEEGETSGLLALMLLQDSRREARSDAKGDLVLLRDQNRSIWNQRQIDEGLTLCARARRAASAGPYTIQAAIAAEHARAPSPESTDWGEIVRLYAELLRLRPTPVIALNHAVAASMAYGAEEGLRLVDALADDLEDYGPFHAARADFCRTTGRAVEAEAAYTKAIALSTNDPERRFLEGRLREVQRSNREPAIVMPKDTPRHDAVDAPSPWVERFATMIRAGGTVLDIAAGRGRHARYLARQGFEVVAVDVDVSRLAGLEDHDRIEIVEADLENAPWPFSGRSFDGIVVVNYLHRPLLSRLAGSVAQNGTLIYDTFADGNERYGRPTNPAFLLREGELLEAFSSVLDVVAYEHGFDETPEPSMRQRICARRSARSETTCREASEAGGLRRPGERSESTADRRRALGSRCDRRTASPGSDPAAGHTLSKKLHTLRNVRRQARDSHTATACLDRASRRRGSPPPTRPNQAGVTVGASNRGSRCR